MSGSGTAIGLSLFIVILVGIIVVGVVWYFLKLRNPRNKSPSHLQGKFMFISTYTRTLVFFFKYQYLKSIYK
jgi:hypothetical protein